MKLNCPTCGPQKNQKFYTKRSGYSLVQCSGCKLVYLERLDQHVDDLFFEDSSQKNEKNKDKIEYWSFPHFFDKYKKIFDFFHQDRWNKLIRFKPNIDSLLDIGCGYGFFLEYIKDKISLAKGIELNEDVANYAINVKKLPVEITTIENYTCSHQFDCIVMCDVLEHVIDPFRTILSCRKLLNKNGVIYIQVPNLTGFKLPLNHSWGLPHHIWQFNDKSLSILLEKSGYTILHKDTGVLGVIGSYERGGMRLFFDKIQWKIADILKIGNRLQIVSIKD